MVTSLELVTKDTFVYYLENITFDFLNQLNLNQVFYIMWSTDYYTIKVVVSNAEGIY